MKAAPQQLSPIHLIVSANALARDMPKVSWLKSGKNGSF
jgi:hypothetical protein